MLVSLFLFGDFVPVLVNQCKNRARLIARLAENKALSTKVLPVDWATTVKI